MARKKQETPEPLEQQLEEETEETEVDEEEIDLEEVDLEEEELVEPEIEAEFEDDESFDEDEESDEEDGEEGDEALDELEAEELALLEDEVSESLLVDEVAELRAIRREELTMDLDAHAIREDEFVCQSCFLVKRTSQLANRRKMICRDCAS
jgi:E3 ubiquitin-protein ligase HUWE1